MFRKIKKIDIASDQTAPNVKNEAKKLGKNIQISQYTRLRKYSLLKTGKWLTYVYLGCHFQNPHAFFTPKKPVFIKPKSFFCFENA